MLAEKSEKVFTTARFHRLAVGCVIYIYIYIYIYKASEKKRNICDFR